MFDKLLEKIRRVDEIESKLLSIFEGKSWEHIAKALYQILDDVDTADDVCKENVEAFRNVVMKLQAKKNEFLYSPDGYSIQKVHECVCHIYGLSDEKLLEFYGSMGNDWNAFNEPYGSDRAEVEAEIQKRGLDVNPDGKKFRMVGGIGESIKEFFDHKRDGKDVEYLIAFAQSRFGFSKLSNTLCEVAAGFEQQIQELSDEELVDWAEKGDISWKEFCNKGDDSMLH